MDAKASLVFSEEELRFLDWAMTFLEGGPFGEDEEEQRHSTIFRVRGALADLERGIRRRVDSTSFYIDCAFCDGTGAFPDVLPIDVSAYPCPVCEGKGFILIRATPENTAECRFCGGHGKAVNSSGYATGEVCPVCKGLGVVVLDGASEGSDYELPWQLIHQLIAKVSRSRFESTHYADAVEAAFKEINAVVKAVVKTETGEELDGAKLMYRALSPTQPIILIADLSTESGRNVQNGYMQLYAGAMTGVRNPTAHENSEMDEPEAWNLLTLASLLMYKLDERAKVNLSIGRSGAS